MIFNAIHRLAARATLLAALVGTAAAAPAASADPLGAVVELTGGLTAGGSPEGMAAGPDGNLWVTERVSKKIARVTPGGAVIEFSGALTQAPGGIVAGPDGNLWFTEASRIGRITTAGVVTEFTAGITPAAGLSEIAVGPDKSLWFTESAAGRIGRITTAGVVSEFVVGGAPTGIAAGADGNVWFTDVASDRIGRMTPAGVVTGFPVSPGAHPARITAGGDGNLWFTEPDLDRIGRITPTGTISEFSAGIVPGSHPLGITAGPDDSLWATSFGLVNMTRLYRISHAGDITALAPGLAPSTGLSGGFLGRGIATGSDGNVWFSDAGGINMIGRVGTGASKASLDVPQVTGSQQALTSQQCSGERWSTWGSQQPVTLSVQWQLDGVAIAGATGRTYKPTDKQVGRDLSCTVTARYELLGTTVSAVSPPSTVLAVAAGVTGALGGTGTGGLTGAPGAAGTNGTNGLNGAAGAAGAKGAAGAAGANGKVQLIKCTKVTKVSKRTKKAATTTKCAGRVVEGTMSFKLETTTKAKAARLTRGRVTYSVRLREVVGGGFTIARTSGKAIPAGRYTLHRGRLATTVTL